MPEAGRVDIFQDQLNSLRREGRYRSLNLACGYDLTSNDYLGMASHPQLREAAIAFWENGGDIGASGSRLLRGHTDHHAALEEYAADFFAAPCALFFASGFQANGAIFQALPSRHDVIIFDEFVHASAREAIQYSHAKSVKVQHNDLDGFEDALKKARSGACQKIWIALEAVYSMDGDITPLDEIYALAETYDAIVILDEAHGTGVMGKDGRGVSNDLIVQHGYDRFVVLHTCGKALGVAGGLVCASINIIDMMINAARGFIYSTAPMPVQAYLVQHALRIVGSEDGGARRERLAKVSRRAKQHFDGPGTHIVPIIIGDNERSVYVADMLQQKGWDIRSIRPPTVPEGTARLRLSLNADMSVEKLDDFAADYEAII